MQTSPPDWLRDLLDLLEGSLTTAARESAGFARDALSALVALVWIALIVVLAIWLGRRVRRWSVKRALAAWPANPNRATLIDQVILVSMVVVAVLFGFRVIGVPANSLVTGIGIFLGALVPANWSLDFVVALTFIGVLAPLLRDRHMAAAALAGALAAVFLDLPLKLNLMAAAAAGVAVAIPLERLWPKSQPGA